MVFPVLGLPASATLADPVYMGNAVFIGGKGRRDRQVRTEGMRSCWTWDGEDPNRLLMSGAQSDISFVDSNDAGFAGPDHGDTCAVKKPQISETLRRSLRGVDCGNHPTVAGVQHGQGTSFYHSVTTYQQAGDTMTPSDSAGARSLTPPPDQPFQRTAAGHLTSPDPCVEVYRSRCSPQGQSDASSTVHGLFRPRSKSRQGFFTACY